MSLARLLPPKAVRRRIADRLQFQERGREAALRRILGLAEGSDETIQRHDKRLSEVAGRISESLSRALDEPSPLPEEIRRIEGMSGQGYRAFINHLVRGTTDAAYLEVGSWGGSTAAAALWSNAARAICIDNWSQFGGPKDRFFQSIDKVRHDGLDFSFIEADFRAVDYGAIGTFNIYLFDGPHEERDQYDGLALAMPALTPEFAFIVDDWNWRFVRTGTFGALRDTGCVIDYAIEVRTTFDNAHSDAQGADSQWHNGYFIAALRRP